MRKVKFKKWIPIEFTEDRLRVKRTGCFEEGFSRNGLFHRWANGYEEFENGVGNYTVALVELEDGTIEEVPPVNLKFDDKKHLARVDLMNLVD